MSEHKKSILILGATGMLGNVVARYFLQQQNKFDLTFSVKNEIPKFLNKASVVKFDALTNEVKSLPRADFVINCIGLIKQRQPTSSVLYYIVNTLLPLKLANKCGRDASKMIHITTDCVFSGRGSWSNEHTVHDAEDDYGRSKSMGEPSSNACMNIRTSIIGEEDENKLGLLEFVKTTKENPIKGFVDHFWNGITTLQFAEVCEHIIEDNLWASGVYHIFSKPFFTKNELIKMINEIYELNKNIEPCQSGNFIDRTLSTKYDLCDKLDIPHIVLQLDRLRNFYQTLSE